MSLIDHSFWPTHHFKFGWIKTFSSNSLIWAILKTVTKFSNVIGYQQPDLSTNRKIFPCALRYSGRCTSFAIHERRNKSYIQVLLVKKKGTFALNYKLVFVYCSVLMQGRGGLGASTRLQLEMAARREPAVHTMATWIVFTLSLLTGWIKMDPFSTTQRHVLESWLPRTVLPHLEKKW
jgi:hypothetical protein